MIGRLTGRLVEKNPPQIVVDIGGVGYELDVPMSTFFALPALGEALSLHTQLIVREDAHLLFGFITPQERSAFRELLKISGVGARTALALLSGLSVSDLTQAVATQDASRLIRVPGIGKKTAERLLLELRGKLGPELAPLASSTEAASADVVHALMALGYSEREAIGATKGLPAGTGVSDGIRLALKSLSKS
ncbi:MAG TPA: Holliday junction branch migration protein RuvA [Burkholderiaceae bacterium]|nr:Holliday junction branch migration protein RuvA [Burkholderiaceae bacterium]